MRIFRKTNVPTWVQVITPLVIDQYFSWNMYSAHTELSIHAKNPFFYEISRVVSYLKAGHLINKGTGVYDVMSGSKYNLWEWETVRDRKQFRIQRMRGVKIINIEISQENKIW